MRKLFVIALAIVAGASFNAAGAAKKDKKKAKETVTAPVELKTGSDSLSYVAGMTLTNGLMSYLQQSVGLDTAYMADFVRGLNDIIAADGAQGMKAYAAGMEIGGKLTGQILPGMKGQFADTPDTLVTAVFYRGFTDALTGKAAHFAQKEAEEMFTAKSAEAKKLKDEKLYGANRDAGRRFLAGNAKKDSVVTLPSGLQYKVLVKGEGEIPAPTDKVIVNYEGRLVDGTVFDASSKHGTKPATFAANRVIAGWTEALTMMPVGSKWQLYIPYELAYGDREAGKIKPYSTLIFDVELVGIDRPEAKKAEAETKVEPAKKAVKKTAKKK